MLIDYVLVLFIGYLLGCLNLAFFIGKLKGFDIRKYGSNNAGASNATITMGAKIGFLVGLHDILKSVIAIFLVSQLFPTLLDAKAIAGASAVLGHIFPFYLKFKGGKGFAPFLGMILGLDWKFFLGIVIIVSLVTLISDYIVVGTLTTIISFPIYIWITEKSFLVFLPVLLVSLVILSKHFVNIKRMLIKEEIGLRRALSKKDKVNKDLENTNEKNS